MMHTSIQRLSLIFEEFFFRTFAAAERTRANSTSKPFGQLDDVLSLATRIVEAIEHVADKVNAESAGFAFVTRPCRGWWRVSARIELTPVIADFDFKGVTTTQEFDLYVVLEAVAVPIFDRVAHHLFNGKVGGENCFGRRAVALEKFGGSDRDPEKIVQIILYFESESGHG